MPYARLWSIRGALLGALGMVAMLLGPTTGSAEPVDEIQALYEAAKADLKDGRHEFALKKFKQALALAENDPENAWPMMMGTALTYEQMGQIEFTLEYYRMFLASAEANRAALTDKWRNRVRVVEEQVSGLEARLLEERGLIEVNTNPAGARIMVDGNAPGADGDAVSPFPVYVNPGSHVLRLEKEGYQPAEISLQVGAGVRQARNVQLVEKRNEGRLLVSTSFPDAAVSVDGAPAGTGRDVSVKVAAGQHLIKVERAGFVPFEKRVEVGADAIVRIEALLQAEESAPLVAKAKPSLAPLWGYLGGGTGVALVAAGAVFSVLRGKDVASISSIDKTDPTGLSAGERKALLDRRDSLASSVNTKGIVAGVFYGVGGAAILGSAAYLIFFADLTRPSADSSTPPSPPPVSLLPIPGGAGLSLTYSW